jgi:hydroxymethylpyrimidine/phosphomethylpyrimidine kinase
MKLQKCYQHCAILLKADIIQKRYRYFTKRDHPFLPKKSSLTEKHGSGCVLSSAIVSNLALGNDLRTACYLKGLYKPIYRPN